MRNHSARFLSRWDCTKNICSVTEHHSEVSLKHYCQATDEQKANMSKKLGAVSIRKTVLPGMAIPMLKIRRPNGRLIFNMEIAIRR